MTPDALFSQISEEIPGFAAAAVGTLDGSSFAAHSTGEADLTHIRAVLPQLVRHYSEVYDGLGGAIDFGSNDELLLTASRGYLLVKVSHEKRRFVAVLLKSSGNLGYLRFRMRHYLRQVG